MSVAIISSDRTMSLLFKVPAPPVLGTTRPPGELYAPPGERNRLESSHAEEQQRDYPVDLRAPEVRRGRLARRGAGGFDVRDLGLLRAGGRGPRRRQPRLRQGRSALDPRCVPWLVERADATRHGPRLLLRRRAAPRRGGLRVLPKGLAALGRAPRGLDRGEHRANDRPEGPVPAIAPGADRIGLSGLLLLLPERARHGRRRFLRDADGDTGLPVAGPGAVGRGLLWVARRAPDRVFPALPRRALPDRHTRRLPLGPTVAGLRRECLRAVALGQGLEGGRVWPQCRIVSSPDGEHPPSHRAVRLPPGLFRGDGREHRGAPAGRDDPDLRRHPSPPGTPESRLRHPVRHTRRRGGGPDRLLDRPRGRPPFHSPLRTLRLYHAAASRPRRSVLRPSRRRGRLYGTLFLGTEGFRRAGGRDEPHALGEVLRLQRPRGRRLGHGGGTGGLLPGEQHPGCGTLDGAGLRAAYRAGRTRARPLPGLPVGVTSSGAREEMVRQDRGPSRIRFPGEPGGALARAPVLAQRHLWSCPHRRAHPDRTLLLGLRRHRAGRRGQGPPREDGPRRGALLPRAWRALPDYRRERVRGRLLSLGATHCLRHGRACAPAPGAQARGLRDGTLRGRLAGHCCRHGGP